MHSALHQAIKRGTAAALGVKFSFIFCTFEEADPYILLIIEIKVVIRIFEAASDTETASASNCECQTVLLHSPRRCSFLRHGQLRGLLSNVSIVVDDLRADEVRI
jgi:hypothetical protein